LLPRPRLEASTWLSVDDQIGTELQRSRTGAVGAVDDILMEGEFEPNVLR
jgi:hypothetical protein